MVDCARENGRKEGGLQTWRPKVALQKWARDPFPPFALKVRQPDCCTRKHTALLALSGSCGAPLGQGQCILSLHMHASAPAPRSGTPTRSVSVRRRTGLSHRKLPNSRGHGGRAGTGPGFCRSVAPTLECAVKQHGLWRAREREWRVERCIE